MAQVTIYLPDELLEAIRREARRARLSVSAFMASLASKKLTSPDSLEELAELYGSCPDLELPEDLAAEPLEPL
jgi:hypothetical protein